jgi:predicted hydrocarbon binding protein
VGVFDTESHNHFKWDKLGDIEEGRGTLGTEMPVVAYRMLEYAMNDILHQHYGDEGANGLWVEAGALAGSEFAKNELDLTLDFAPFVAQLQAKLKDLKIGLLRIEEFDEANGAFVLTVGEDLDCSGLPPTNEVVCTWDEGFLAGILKAYTGKDYTFKEVDCWANGDRVCRFKGGITAVPSE